MNIAIHNASPGWELIMQSGAQLGCTVNIPLRRLLLEEFAIAPETLRRIDVLLLDGKPVDEPDKAIVPEGARIALAAGLPGIAGLAMKSGSAVRGLRPGITHREETRATDPAPGHVELALFSLSLPFLAAHFLQRGVRVSAGQILRYARLTGGDDQTAKNDSPVQCAVCDGQTIAWNALEAVLRALPEGELVNFSAVMS